MCPELDCQYAIGLGAYLVIRISLAQAYWCIKEAIRILFQYLMKTICTYNSVQVAISFPPLSIMSVHYTVSQVLQVRTIIVLIKICLTIYGVPICMYFGIEHKEHCTDLLACLLKNSQQANIWAFKCFQYHQVPIQLIMMWYCKQLLVCWPVKTTQLNMTPSKKIVRPQG